MNQRCLTLRFSRVRLNGMAKLLICTSLLMQLASAILLSLGVLTPEVVRTVGARVAGHILTRPDSLLLKLAHARIIGSKVPAQDKSTGSKELLAGLLSHVVERCSIAFKVFALTYVLAVMLSLLLVFGFSLWGLLAVALAAHARTLLLAFSIAGLLISGSGICAIFGPSERSGEPRGPFASLLLRVLRIASLAWSLTYPLQWLMFQLVSLFTMAMPLAWYWSLKAIHERGVNWATTLVGLTLFLVSLALQFSVLFITH